MVDIKVAGKKWDCQDDADYTILCVDKVGNKRKFSYGDGYKGGLETTLIDKPIIDLTIINKNLARNQPSSKLIKKHLYNIDVDEAFDGNLKVMKHYITGGDRDNFDSVFVEDDIIIDWDDEINNLGSEDSVDVLKDKLSDIVRDIASNELSDDVN